MRVSLAVMTILAMTACSTPQPPAEAAAENTAYDRGQALVEANCSGCHARFPGEASRNPASPSFATLFRNYPPEYLQEAFAEGVFTGHNDMPAFTFTPGQIDDLIVYLKTLEEQ